MINRGAIVLRPKAPYQAWASSLPGESAPVDFTEDQEVYLIPEFEDEEEIADILEQAWPVLFESQLDAWSQDEDLWPGDRTFEMFAEWFDVSIHSIVIDLAEGEIIDEWRSYEDDLDEDDPEDDELDDVEDEDVED